LFHLFYFYGYELLEKTLSCEIYVRKRELVTIGNSEKTICYTCKADLF